MIIRQKAHATRSSAWKQNNIEKINKNEIKMPLMHTANIIRHMIIIRVNWNHDTQAFLSSSSSSTSYFCRAMYDVRVCMWKELIPFMKNSRSPAKKNNRIPLHPLISSGCVYLKNRRKVDANARWHFVHIGLNVSISPICLLRKRIYTRIVNDRAWQRAKQSIGVHY